MGLKWDAIHTPFIVSSIKTLTSSDFLFIEKENTNECLWDISQWIKLGKIFLKSV